MFCNKVNYIVLQKKQGFFPKTRDMRIELILFLGTVFLVSHIYTEGRLVKRILAAKKYFQMGGVILGACFLYYLIRHNPMRARDILQTTNEYVKYLPVDQNARDYLRPILDFTAKHGPSFGPTPSPTPLGGMGGGNLGSSTTGLSRKEQRLINSGRGEGIRGNLKPGGRTATSVDHMKRSVSGMKKRWVAARQHWNCGHCQKELNAWFEVDHIRRLEHGGSNHVDNLVALCRECHGEKTAIENL